MPLLEGDAEEAKEGSGLIISIPNKLLIRISVLLAQIKTGSNSYTLEKQENHQNALP